MIVQLVPGIPRDPLRNWFDDSVRDGSKRVDALLFQQERVS